MSSKEECALGMGQRPNDAAVKDVQIKLRREECAENMEHTARDGSEFGKTMLTFSIQRLSATLARPVPREVVLCGVIAANNYEEV
jgi:hypothetical protein